MKTRHLTPLGVSVAVVLGVPPVAVLLTAAYRGWLYYIGGNR